MRTARHRTAAVIRALSVALAVTLSGAACGGPAPAPVAQPTPPPTTPYVPLPGIGGVTTVAPPPATSVAPDPGQAPVVVLDPGHNGGNGTHATQIGRQVPDGRGGTKPCNTTGTSTDAGYPEHAFAFDVATRVARRLTASGIRVAWTRTTDDGVGPCVDERGAAGAKYGAAAVVSIHADGSAARNSGFHVALSAPPLNDSQRVPASSLAAAVRDAMVAGGFAVSDYIGHDGLSPRPDLAGLNLATRPAVLVECGNMRNAAEAATMTSPEGRDRYAAAIAAGTLAYLRR